MSSLLEAAARNTVGILPMIETLLVAGLLLWAAHHFLLVRPKVLEGGQRFYRQLAMIGLTLVGLLAVVMSLPVAESTRNQVIGLLGLVISGAIAFSSTTIIANLMAGIMIRVTRPFRTGDFIQVETHAGRVTELGLLDTEIQTEMRELVALPNAYLIARPVSVVRSSGAVVSTTLSLGYELHHARIERLLVQAADRCGLKDAFVQVLELGDFSVTYRISGLLEDVRGLLTARSQLSRCVLDTLHEDGVEIVSPTFTNRRQIGPETRVIPVPERVVQEPAAKAAEDIVFDKAEDAEQTERRRMELAGQITALEEALKTASETDKEQKKMQLDAAHARLKAFDEAVTAAKAS